MKRRALKHQVARAEERIRELTQQVEAMQCCCQCGEAGDGENPIDVGDSDEGSSNAMLKNDKHFDPARTFGESSRGINCGQGERCVRRRRNLYPQRA